MSAKHSSLNDKLHRLLGVDEPCANACTHFLTERWTALGLANVAHRVEERSASDGSHTSPSEDR